MPNKRTDCSNLTVAMQKRKWRKTCSKCYRLRYANKTRVTDRQKARAFMNHYKKTSNITLKKEDRWAKKTVNEHLRKPTCDTEHERERESSPSRNLNQPSRVSTKGRQQDQIKSTPGCLRSLVPLLWHTCWICSTTCGRPARSHRCGEQPTSGQSRRKVKTSETWDHSGQLVSPPLWGNLWRGWSAPDFDTSSNRITY